MQRTPDCSIREPSKPLITISDVVLPLGQEVTENPTLESNLYHHCRSDTNSVEDSLTESDSTPSHSYQDSPWAQPKAFESLLKWKSRVDGDDLDTASVTGSRSEIFASFCFSTIKDYNQSSESELISAIMYVNQNRAGELFDLLVEQPELVEMQDNRGNHLIHYAVTRGFLRIIDLLVSRGADPDIPNSQGQTPLHLAILEQQVAVLNHLILLGCNAESANNRGAQPIHLACELNDVESLKELLRSARIDINAPGEFGGTVVHCCCRKNSIECLRIVLSLGADLFKADAIGKYPIHVAVSSGSLDCLKILLEYEATAKTEGLAVGGVEGEGAVIFIDNHLINLQDSEGETALHLAVNSGNIEMIDFCLDHGSDVTAVENHDFTAVHYAARRGEVMVLQRLLNRRPEETVSLLSCVNRNGHTPLHLAVMYNHADLTACLIKWRSPMEVQDKDGWTPLLLATAKCAIAACLTLIQFGANLHALDLSQRNVLHLAIIHGALKDEALWRQIREHGLYKRLIGEEDDCGCTALHYATEGGSSMLCVTRDLLASGANCLHQNGARETPLHLAAKRGCVATVESLLRTDHGLWSMNTCDAQGLTPLHIAAANAQTRVVSLLIAKGSSFRRCQKGRTPLHWAAQVGSLETCKVILGANTCIIDARDFRGMTALHYAAQKDHDSVVTYLMDKEAKFTQDRNGLYFTSFAFKKENIKAARAVINNRRWDEIIELLNHTDQCPIEKVIREIPSLCPIIMDRYIKEEGNPSRSNYEVTYDFSILQPKAALLDRTQHSPLHLLKVMISLQRDELIVHPLCHALLRCKWRRYGLWVHCMSSAFYINFLACLTFLVLDHEPLRHSANTRLDGSCYNLVFCTAGRRRVQAIMSYVIAFTSAACMLEDIVLIFSEGLKFFKDLINFYSLSVFAVATAYAVMSLHKVINHNFIELGAIALFLAWSYFVIHLMRFKVVGIFVVMFFQVAGTLGKSAVVVILVLISCALPFYVLFKLPDFEAFRELPVAAKEALAQCFPAYEYIYEKERNGSDPMDMTPMLSAFQTPELAILNVFSMSLGDFNFVDTIIEPLTDDNRLTMHFPEVTLVMFVIFLLFAPMILTNLLVGLAVGDIDAVRQQAAIRLISQTVDWHDRIEAALPRKLYGLIVSSVWKSKSCLDSPSVLISKDEKNNMNCGSKAADFSVLSFPELLCQMELQNKETRELIACMHEQLNLPEKD
ncbi:Transient receptor potential cation channel subfamily A member 1 [Taenia crassiceps]|uniref:Transient receptor potential cation channel subfamily A member 1 n=1 Tax=Taenia crassiceps TaxID=6207 RepID=A0ABR4QG94_9CEST